MPARRILPKATGDDQDTEGHASRRMPKVTGDDDTEGHASRRMPKATGDDEDTEGHASRRLPKATGDDDDTEGQSMLSNPLLNRQLASAREQDIQRHLKQRQNSPEGQRPNNKRGRD